LVKIREHTVQAALTPTPAMVVVAAGVQDPGNFGTLIRSAEAFGATAAFGVEGTVNPWNPKTVRASAGSIFRIPVLKVNTDELMRELQEHQIATLALAAVRPGESFGDGTSHRKPRRLQDADLTRPCALFVGNEGAGLSRELISKMAEFVAIPQTTVESLNAGVAASIALYETQRQRSASQ
jgi:TrmH family RNA methyltransferase